MLRRRESGISLSPSPSQKRSRRDKPRRAFDMSVWARRDVALWLSYEGEAYSGLADQRDVDGVETVEKVLFEALVKCCLIESRETCRYSRCGRTDRGVSAQGQVVGLRVRSALRSDDPRASEEGVAPPLQHPCDEIKPGRTELDYCDMLNRVLPADVRAVAWRSVSVEFSARFSAASRTYRYFFVKAPYDLERMRDAAQRLVGEHDFRNLCKMDVEHIKNYRRLVYGVRVVESPVQGVAYFEITGQAFLWHMVRCCVAVLFLVGLRLEAPDVVDALLDVDAEIKRRPQYDIAPEAPLVLHDCAFDTLRPTPTPQALARLAEHHQTAADRALVLAARRRNALECLDRLELRRTDLDAFLGKERASSDDVVLEWARARAEVRAAKEAKLAASYRSLRARPSALTYEERVEAMGPRKRDRLEANERKRQESAPIDQAFHEEKRRAG